jgi:hypothetical protein
MKRRRTFKPNSLLLIIFVTLSVFRFVSLGKVPIFGDEANHLMLADKIWGQLGMVVSAARGGILPGLLIPLSLFLKLFSGPINPLLIGRSFSVICDLISSYLIYLIGKRLFRPEVGVFAAIIYLLIPLNIFHSRLVMLEPLMSASFLAALYFLIKFVDSPYEKLRHGKTFIYGLAVFVFLFVSFITKPLMAVSLPAFAALPIIYRRTSKSKILLVRKLIVVLILVLTVFAAALPLIRLSSNHFYDDYVLRNSGVLWLNFKTNLWRSFLWIKVYYPGHLLIISVLGFIFGLKRSKAKIFWILGWAFTIVVLDSLVGGKLFYPRHLFPLAVPVSFLAAFFLAGLWQRKEVVFKAAVLVLVFLMWFTSLNYVFNPEKAWLAPEDRLQFYEDWSSGVGLTQVASDLKQLSGENKITVYVGDEALLTWALPRVFDIGQTNIKVVNNYFGGESPNLEDKIKRGENTYLLLNRVPYIPTNFRAELVVSYPKGGGRSLVLYCL